jgi:DNA polymerase-1
MEIGGISISTDALREFGASMNERIAALKEGIYSDAGKQFNINSTRELGEVLFEQLGLRGGKKTKTGYSTAVDVLEKLRSKHPIVDKVLDYRTVTKLKSTYVDGLLAVARNQKIHSTFNQTVASTGRLSSSEPNLQNIPVRTEMGRLLRKAFTARSGCVFIDGDYSQIELRVLAHMSGDEELINAFKSGLDIHRLTASQVFHTDFDDVTPFMRSAAKAVNFGIIYGQSAFGLAQGLDIGAKEADEYIKSYLARFPKVKAFLNNLISSAREKGYAETLYGRRRKIPELNHNNFNTRSFGERAAMNMPVQGTAADIIKIAMIRTYNRIKREGLGARLILQVHDELLLEAPDSEIEQSKRVLTEEMEGAASLSVPLVVDARAGATWYNAK